MRPENCARVSAILNAMRNLLLQVHEYDRAYHLELLLNAINDTPQDVLDVLESVEFWGGAGSFSDLYFTASNGNVSDDFQRDNHEYANLLAKLIDVLKAEGFDNPRMRGLRDHFSNVYTKDLRVN
ncbi:MAG TPA: hypothetical protein DCL60_02615 [Armatimonadetes bacterium]|jgi:hypothetical protein|nr:hypothetical protein [Armatimonadota bacterium]